VRYWEKLLQRLLSLGPVAWAIRVSQKIIIPGFDGLPLYDVAVFFIRGLQKGALTMRAAAMSFSFFLAIFPSIIFFFTLIPYIPVSNFQQTLMVLLEELMPDSAFDTVRSTLEDIISRPRSGLLSLGFILAGYFSTNGIASMIEAFNQTYHTIETRSWMRQRLISILLVLILAVIVILAIAMITTGSIVIDFMVQENILHDSTTVFFLQVGKWIVILAMVFFVISFIYFLAPSRESKFRFVSAGSTLATLLSIVTMLGFNYYISNFTRYNALYGSIGTLLVVMLWIYFNAIILLIGFELNASIYASGAHKYRRSRKS